MLSQMISLCRGYDSAQKAWEDEALVSGTTSQKSVKLQEDRGKAQDSIRDQIQSCMTELEVENQHNLQTATSALAYFHAWFTMRRGWGGIPFFNPF